MTNPVATLQNQHLTARISHATGLLVWLSHAGDNGNLLAGAVADYHHLPPGVTYVKSPSVPGLVSIATHPHSITTQLEDENLSLTLTYTLKPDSPLLEIQTTLQSKQSIGGIRFAAFPGLHLAPGFNNTFEDPRDLYFDGAELGNHVHLPAWRVFFRQGYQDGLILAGRARQSLGRFNYTANALEHRLLTTCNYSINLTAIGELWPLTPGKTITSTFELGPWRETDHTRILHDARLHLPFQTTPAAHPSLPVAPTPPHALRAADIADTTIALDTYRSDRWLLINLPDPTQPTGQKQVLFANPGVTPPPLLIHHHPQGPHRVFVGIAHGAGALLRIAPGAPWHHRLSPVYAHSPLFYAPFTTALDQPHPAQEVDFGVLDLGHHPIQIARHPDKHLVSFIDYIRFEKASSSDQPVHPKPLDISGFIDTPDIAWLVDAANPDPSIIPSVIQAHADAGITKLHWRIDGQCSDFPSKTNTMRYISAKVHGVYTPQSKAYGRLLQKTDVLALAAQSARSTNVQLWGWMRFNGYSGNVTSDFFNQNPAFHDESEAGTRVAKLCIAFEEVRRHKIQILVEAASYGLQGLCLGFLRNPPVLLYAKVMCDAYQQAYGVQPPRDPKHPDPRHNNSLPIRQDPHYLRWWQFRADYLTTFGRELRQALKAANLSHVKIALWVRPHHCLFEGIDLPAWLSEGLCDEVISSPYLYPDSPKRPDWYWETAQWRSQVRARVPLTRDIGPHFHEAQADLQHILANDYDGVCFYESNQVTLEPDFIRTIQSLRKAVP